MAKGNGSESAEANQIMGEKFKDYDSRNFSAADSDVNRSNQEIQKQFYGNDEEDNFLPFHIENGIPPIKK